ncbi:MAG: sigma-70 family RNA polymerase sigma factor [Actinomycetes bacterium]
MDPDQLRQLHDEHAPALLAYAHRLTSGDRAWAEDVVQETLLRAWRHPEAFEPGTGSSRGWLLTVARNIVMDHHRARRARPREIGEAALDTERPVSADDDPIDRALQSWTIADALSTLSGEHRAVLLETFYRGRSVAEAAEVLGVPPGTIKSRTFYALKALRLALAEREVV